jgi:hypothetical protein
VADLDIHVQVSKLYRPLPASQLVKTEFQCYRNQTVTWINRIQKLKGKKVKLPGTPNKSLHLTALSEKHAQLIHFLRDAGESK